MGTYAVGWTEYRIVLDFTADTYTLVHAHHRRDAWTQLKATAHPPTPSPCVEATDRTTTANLLFRGYQNANLWLDDVRFSDTGIVDAPAPATSLRIHDPVSRQLPYRGHQDRRHRCRGG